MLSKVIEKITEQQKNHSEDTTVYAVGEQLKEICQKYRGAAELVLRDLDVRGMSIADAEKRIHDLANKKQKESKTSCICISPSAAEAVICEFYGINTQLIDTAPPDASAAEAATQDDIINLEDFL